MFHAVNQRDSSKICGDYLCMPDAGGRRAAIRGNAFARAMRADDARSMCGRFAIHAGSIARSMRDPWRDPWRDPCAIMARSWRDQGTLLETRNSSPMQRASAQRLRRRAYTLTRPDRSRCAISLRLLRPFRMQRKPSANPASCDHAVSTNAVLRRSTSPGRRYTTSNVGMSSSSFASDGSPS